MKQFVLFRTGIGEFAIPIGSVREVRQDPLLAVMPGAQPAIAGIFDWKGQSLLVISALGDGRHIIVVDGGPGTYAIKVEEVLELAHRSDRELRAPAADAAVYVTGSIRAEGQVVPVLDPDLLWSSLRAAPRSTRP